MPLRIAKVLFMTPALRGLFAFRLGGCLSRSYIDRGGTASVIYGNFSAAGTSRPEHRDVAIGIRPGADARDTILGIGNRKGLVVWRKGSRGVCADLLIVGGSEIPAADVRKSP